MPEFKYVTTPYSYSSAVVAGGQVYLGLHRGGGETFAEQMDDAIQGISRTLAELGLSLDHVVKVTVWLKNVKDLPEMEKAFLRYFKAGHYPARMTATTEFIDDDCLIMIEGMAVIA